MRGEPRGGRGNFYIYIFIGSKILTSLNLSLDISSLIWDSSHIVLKVKNQLYIIIEIKYFHVENKGIVNFQILNIQT